MSVVWALFDSETDTVKKSLPEHEVYSFGIGSGTEHLDLDLGDFETAKKELDKYPKPDIIFASPPCESWVNLSIGNLRRWTQEKGINLHWKSKWVPFDFKPEYRETRINGINTAVATAKLIQHYKPELWAIENGNSSMIFNYIHKHCEIKGYYNKCNYHSYGFEVLKPTIIYSNKILILRNFKRICKLKKTIEGMGYEGMGYGKTIARRKNKIGVLENERSKVPPELYRDIMRQFMHGGQRPLFPAAGETL